MKRAAFAVLCFLLAASLCACGGSVKGVETHEIGSAVFSEKDIRSAVEVIEKEFRRE